MTVRVMDFIFSAAWAMDQASLEKVIEIASRDHHPTVEALEAYRAQALARGERAKERDGVAIITAEGPMFKRANLMTEYSGATSYDVLRRDLQAAIDNPAIHSILLNLDTPGGEAAGVGELASAVAGFRGVKPIVAYAGDLAASAGYWLASAADSIVIGPGAALGSIGVRAAYSDTSARDAARGVNAVEFVSSQSPFKKADLTTDEGRNRIQARIDAMAQVFVETVAENRGVEVAHVLDAFGKGDVLIGQAAVAAGMADAIGTFESTLAKLASGETRFGSADRPGARRATNMEQKMTPEEIQAKIDAALTAERATAAERQAAAVTAALAEASTAASAAASAAATAAVEADRKRVEEITALTITGYEAEASEAIRSGSTASDFALMIVKAEKGKGAQRASAIESDETANAGVKVGRGAEVPAAPKGDDAAVDAILKARALASGAK